VELSEDSLAGGGVRGQLEQEAELRALAQEVGKRPLGACTVGLSYSL